MLVSGGVQALTNLNLKRFVLPPHLRIKLRKESSRGVGSGAELAALTEVAVLPPMSTEVSQ